jgi:hypothetical protein
MSEVPWLLVARLGVGLGWCRGIVRWCMLLEDDGMLLEETDINDIEAKDRFSKVAAAASEFRIKEGVFSSV